MGSVWKCPSYFLSWFKSREICVSVGFDVSLARTEKSEFFNILMYHVINVFFVYFQKRDDGNVLLEKVFYHLDIIEKDYFGLQFTDHNNVSVSTPAFLSYIINNLSLPSALPLQSTCDIDLPMTTQCRILTH